MTSKKYKLNAEDGKKIGKGALIATGASLLTYVALVITQIDFGPQALVVVPIASVLINAARKWLANQNA